MLTIGKLADVTGVSRDTVRFYERSGLLRPASRTDTGYRLYDEEEVQRIAFIKEAQLCGLSLATIRELLEPANGGDPRACAAYRAAVAECEPLERRIEALRAMRQKLGEFVRRCDRGGPGSASGGILSTADGAVPPTVPWPCEAQKERHGTSA